MTALSVALEALEQIAARGIVKFSFVEPREGGAARIHCCPLCKGFQAYQGTCGNRECVANIARRGIDEARRAL